MGGPGNFARAGDIDITVPIGKLPIAGFLNPTPAPIPHPDPEIDYIIHEFLDVGYSMTLNYTALQFNDFQGIDFSTVKVTSSVGTFTPSLSSLGPLLASDLPDNPSVPNLAFTDTSGVTITATPATGPIEIATFAFSTFGVPVPQFLYVAAETTNNSTGLTEVSFGIATFTAVPEPSTMVLLLTSLPLVVLWAGVRRRSAKAA